MEGAFLMQFHVRSSDNIVLGYGLTLPSPKTAESYVVDTNFDPVTKGNLLLVDSLGRRQWRWNRDILALEQIPEKERIIEYSSDLLSSREEWTTLKATATAADQITFLAKRLGLE